MAANKKITLDDLAAMVQNGFCDMENKFDGKIGSIGQKIERIENDLGLLKEGQERIELRLCNVAYHFEFAELEKRVTILEQKNRAKSGK